MDLSVQIRSIVLELSRLTMVLLDQSFVVRNRSRSLREGSDPARLISPNA